VAGSDFSFVSSFLVDHEGATDCSTRGSVWWVEWTKGFRGLVQSGAGGHGVVRYEGI
tara:strand:- start:2 stop:172 length:171 start_codon:yes stop_codon:yes gene_type:complete